MATTMTSRQRILPVGPILLIGIGGLLLLSNAGLVSGDLWTTLVKLWPLALVLLGVQALVTGRVDWLSLAVLLATFGVLSLGSHLLLAPPRGVAAGLPIVDRFEQPLQGAQRARVRVEFGAGELTIGSLAAGGPLARGTLAADGGGRLQSDYRVRDGVGVLEVGARGGSHRFGGFDRRSGGSEQVGLNLAAGIPIDLEVSAGAARGTLDLRELTIPVLRYETGASQSTIMLPAGGVTRAEIRGGAAAIAVEVPPGVAARIRTGTSGLSQVNVDQGRFPRVGEVYESPDWAGASDRVDLTLNVGVANVEVR